MDKTTTNTQNKGWEPKDGDVCFLSAKHNHLIIFRKFKNDIISSYVNITFAYDQTDESGTTWLSFARPLIWRGWNSSIR